AAAPGGGAVRCARVLGARGRGGARLHREHGARAALPGAATAAQPAGAGRTAAARRSPGRRRRAGAARGTPMSERDRIDPDDPFGTRPDENPPRGWDETFWSGVRARIQREGGGPGSEEPPTEPRHARPTAVGVVVMAAALALAAGFAWSARPSVP